MAKVILITGFNNWGKTRLIHDLFNSGAFQKKQPHHIQGINVTFTVCPYSNDDWGAQKFKDELTERLDLSPEDAEDLITAFCPTMEPSNLCVADILDQPPLRGFAEKHCLLIVNKWDQQAVLKVNRIRANLGNVSGIHFHNISGKTANSKLTQARSYIQSLYP